MTVGVSLLSIGAMVVTMILFSSIIVDNIIYLQNGRKATAWDDVDWKAVGVSTLCAVTVLVFDAYTTVPAKQITYQTIAMICLQFFYIFIGVRIHRRIWERSSSLMEETKRRTSNPCVVHTHGQSKSH